MSEHDFKLNVDSLIDRLLEGKVLTCVYLFYEKQKINIAKPNEMLTSVYEEVRNFVIFWTLKLYWKRWIKQLKWNNETDITVRLKEKDRKIKTDRNQFF